MSLSLLTCHMIIMVLISLTPSNLTLRAACTITSGRSKTLPHICFGTLLGVSTIYVIFTLISSIMDHAHYTKFVFVEANATASLLVLLLFTPLTLEEKPFSDIKHVAIVEAMVSSMLDVRIIVGIFTLPFLFFSPNNVITDLPALSTNGLVISLIFCAVQPFTVGLLWLMRYNMVHGDITPITVLSFFAIAVVLIFIFATKLYGCAFELQQFELLYPN
ncbi:hypothetical protein [Vibrio alginolyticus]|uniref:hypothetical protein n=1 Tax=Vibrio alginolyticus TaxID=663 RepID=UPI000A6232A0|nr:hypothetical protein [Vibrio alginolyticus]